MSFKRALTIGLLISVVLAVSAGRLSSKMATSSAVELDVSANSSQNISLSSERIIPDPIRLIVLGNSDVTDYYSSPPVPGLKPRRRRAEVPVDIAIDPSAVYLGVSTPVAIAPAEDFTGGREALFAEYAQAQAEKRAERGYRTFVLGRGETLAKTLQSLGADDESISRLTNSLLTVIDVADIEAGTAIDYAFEPVRQIIPIADDGIAPVMNNPSFEHKLMRVRFRPDERHLVTLWRQRDGKYKARREEIKVEKRFAAVAGVVDNSLFAAGEKAEIPPEVMQHFANLFLYDIDFARDVRSGDKFEIVYEVFHDRAGEYVASGDILLGAMTWRGQRETRTYYRFNQVTDMENPYFGANGESATRLLMKTPIEGASISSGFGMRRHPVLGYSAAHKGIDFAAPRGTPIMAAGDGVIERAAPTGTFGNYIKIKHRHGYETAYAHLKSFASGIKAGKKVRQGQIIGYVGSTGRSTGPHLHYEVHKSGDVLNPMALKIANGRVLEEELFDDFESERLFLDSLRVHPFTVASATKQ